MFKLPMFPKKEKVPVAAPPPKATAPQKAAAPSSSSKKPVPQKFLIGLILVITAFVGVIIIIYMMMQATMQKEEKIGELNDLMSQLKNEKNIIQEELASLKAQGDSIKLDKLIEVARSFYDDKELSRREGLVWLNRKNKTYLVTLGAVHGLSVGSTLGVYDGEKKIGTLQVETPYDVISFTTPVKLQDSAGKNYYRVVIE